MKYNAPTRKYFLCEYCAKNVATYLSVNKIKTFLSPDPAVWWHYMLEMAFYWSLLVTQFTDVKRKDFWEMFVHHLATLALLTLR